MMTQLIELRIMADEDGDGFEIPILLLNIVSNLKIAVHMKEIAMMMLPIPMQQ